jgi:alkylation response protein AidB-like acyl-CoA dehydrogenase
MPSYHAPLNDMRFILTELWPIKEYLNHLPTYQDIDPELLMTVLEEAAKFCQHEIFPLNQVGDQQGCKYHNGLVTTPDGFKEAYQHLVEAGWLTLNVEVAEGGQGLPKIVQVFFDEMLASCNVAFSLYTVLTQGVYHALKLYASYELQSIYLPNIASGKWSGTMCLTEAHCGSDLGLLKTKAIPEANGSYRLYGTKIFITSGEHDLTENIIHTVLARLPDAPPGVKGISFFVVPKFLVNQDGSLGERNHLHCGSIEHKMGIKGSCTCVMNYDGAIGYLIGKPHEGLKVMFSMMNLERINIGLEGLGLAETAYQNALHYAKDRLQGRSPYGPAYPEKPADPIIVHPDVRRMLLTIKTFTEGARALAAWIALLVDVAKFHTEEKTRTEADQLIALLTPIIKAYFTDQGFDSCNLALQIFGGHGYIKEWGMEQYVRDARIAQIYEGTNGIQALDLVKRKLVLNNGESVNLLISQINGFINEHLENKKMHEYIYPLQTCVQILQDVSHWIIKQSKHDQALLGVVARDYLNLLATSVLAFVWGKIASIAANKSTDIFYQSKMKTAQFFFQRILPIIFTLKYTITADNRAVMAMNVEEF